MQSYYDNEEIMTSQTRFVARASQNGPPARNGPLMALVALIHSPVHRRVPPHHGTRWIQSANDTIRASGGPACC